jgi:hypothetical protein
VPVWPESGAGAPDTPPMEVPALPTPVAAAAGNAALAALGAGAFVGAGEGDAKGGAAAAGSVEPAGAAEAADAAEAAGTVAVAGSVAAAARFVGGGEWLPRAGSFSPPAPATAGVVGVILRLDFAAASFNVPAKSDVPPEAFAGSCDAAAEGVVSGAAGALKAGIAAFMQQS